MIDRRKVACLSLVILSVFASGCAKRPLSTGSRDASPPPSGSAGAAPASAAVGAAVPAGGGATAGQPAGAGGAAGSSAASAGASSGSDGARLAASSGPPRPDPKQFAAAPRLRDIHFDFDKYAIRPDDATILDANVDWLISNPAYLVLIEGHCDERGTNQYNIALGEHRARAAMNYMVARGVQAERITTLSYGKERPACLARTESCWATNRRAHFLVKAAPPVR